MTVKSFSAAAITSKSLKDNVRPFVVRDSPASLSPRVLWMHVNHYEHYTNYSTAIKGNKAAGKFSADLDSEDIMKVMSAVAGWQIDNFTSVPHHQLDWTNGALYAGMMEFAKISQDRKYTDWLYRIGRTHLWQPHRNIYHADDIAVCQMYLEMYRQKKSDRLSYLILAPTQARLDYVISHPSGAGLLLDYSDPQTTERWSWCDALFMAPPVYAKLSAITGDDKYLEFMDREYKATWGFLYDKEEHLFYRDHRYFPEKVLEANSSKVFWGRGNGWVMGGLVSLLKELPDDSVYRPFYERLFTEMAQKVASCQGKEGFWHASMLDHQSFPNPETSSSAFFCYALAYGVNSGLLDKEIFTPVVRRAWKALVSAVFADGKLGWVQPVGQDPKVVTPDMTEVYGVGAFLLAGTEMMIFTHNNH
ncbi:MAG: glycoside hydrolase family 88 protein [Bacteroidales bacterium]|nr:glycoside hydrolase family 88 protein [Bacteroidales bacterium]